MRDIIERVEQDERHRAVSKVCPGCGADCYSVGIVYLAYTYRTCECGEPEFDHLTEQLWHLACLQGRDPEVELAAAHLAYIVAPYANNPEGRTKAGARAAIARLDAALKASRQATEATHRREAG